MVGDLVTDDAAIVVEHSVDLAVPVRIAYNPWTQFELLPQFLEGIESVTQMGGSRLHWVGEIDGVRCEWTALVTRQRPDRSIRWECGPGSARYDGTVTFQSLEGDRSRVSLRLETGGHDAGDSPERSTRAVERAVRSLARFKAYVEARGAACREWQGWATTTS